MISKILCATDGTGHSSQAVRLAAEIAKKLAAELTVCVVNVARASTPGPPVYAWDDAQVKRILDDAASAARAAGAPMVEETVLRGREASAAIVQFAEENGFDHIVVGTGGKRGVSRLILGSVAADVAGRAHCSVTVAR